MKLTIDGPPTGDETPTPLLKRLGWFVALWCGGLLAVAAAAYGLRALIL